MNSSKTRMRSIMGASLDDFAASIADCESNPNGMICGLSESCPRNSIYDAVKKF
jgi:hypothetical protein